MPDKIPGGYILLARKMLESAVMDKPPLYLKLWVWMLLQAKFKGDKRLKRGQFLTSIREMQEAMSHYIGYRKVAPTKKQIRDIYEGLREASTIGTTKVTSGLLITIIKYDEYQDPKNYEGHNEKSTKGTTRAHLIKYKEREEGNKGGNNNHRPKRRKKKFTPPTVEQVKQYFADNGYLESVGIKAWEYYRDGKWHDSSGKPVLSWKQKMRGVWFRDEYKAKIPEPVRYIDGEQPVSANRPDDWKAP